MHVTLRHHPQVMLGFINEWQEKLGVKIICSQVRYLDITLPDESSSSAFLVSPASLSVSSVDVPCGSVICYLNIPSLFQICCFSALSYHLLGNRANGHRWASGPGPAHS